MIFQVDIVIADVFGSKVVMRLFDIEDACELLRSYSLKTLQDDSVRQCCSKYKALTYRHMTFVSSCDSLRCEFRINHVTSKSQVNLTL